MTKLCAGTMGFFSYGEWSSATPGLTDSEIGAQRFNGDKCLPYDPLHDDAQAMALVKKFHLSVNNYAETPNVWEVWIDATPDYWTGSNELNRAIVECVAKMQANAATAHAATSNGNE